MLTSYLILLAVTIVVTGLVWIAYYNPDFLVLFRGWVMDEVALDPVERAGGYIGPRYTRKHLPVGLILLYLLAFILFFVFTNYLDNSIAGVVFIFLFGLFRYQSHLLTAQKKQDIIDLQAEMALRFLSASYSATRNMEQAIEHTAGHIKQPLKGEFEHVIADINSGRTIAAALNGLADRLQNRDITVFVKSVILSEKMGTDTAVIINKVSRRIEDEIDVKEDSKNETKGQNFTVNIFLTVLPVALFIAIAFFPSARETLKNNILGRCLLTFSFFVEYFAWYFMRGRRIDF